MFRFRHAVYPRIRLFCGSPVLSVGEAWNLSFISSHTDPHSPGKKRKMSEIGVERIEESRREADGRTDDVDGGKLAEAPRKMRSEVTRHPAAASVTWEPLYPSPVSLSTISSANRLALPWTHPRIHRSARRDKSPFSPSHLSRRRSCEERVAGVWATRRRRIQLCPRDEHSRVASRRVWALFARLSRAECRRDTVHSSRITVFVAVKLLVPWI